jgi:hypothetical protein
MTDDRPTIDRDALITETWNRQGPYGVAVWKAQTETRKERYREQVRPFLDTLDAETRRADAAEAEVARLREFGVALTVSAERDAARAERDSLAERIAAAEAEVERLREGWNVLPVPSLLALVEAENERLLNALDAETRRAAAAEARIASLETWQHIANARIVNTEAERDSLGERIAAAIEAESNATSGRAFETHDEFCEYREGMTTAARIARETT